MPTYQYSKSHCGDKTILRPSYLHNRISYTGKPTSLCWYRALHTSISPVCSHLYGIWGCEYKGTFFTYCNRLYIACKQTCKPYNVLCKIEILGRNKQQTVTRIYICVKGCYFKHPITPHSIFSVLSDVNFGHSSLLPGFREPAWCSCRRSNAYTCGRHSVLEWCNIARHINWGKLKTLKKQT